jgi:hypothetical protein
MQGKWATLAAVLLVLAAYTSDSDTIDAETRQEFAAPFATLPVEPGVSPSGPVRMPTGDKAIPEPRRALTTAAPVACPTESDNSLSDRRGYHKSSAAEPPQGQWAG